MAKKTAKVPTFVRLPAMLRKQLEEIASKEVRTVSNLLVVAAAEFVERHNGQKK